MCIFSYALDGRNVLSKDFTKVWLTRGRGFGVEECFIAQICRRTWNFCVNVYLRKAR